MNIGGLTKVSLSDYSGNVVAVVFTQGCNLRCPYCHNPEFIKKVNGNIEEEELFGFLEKNKKMLDGVCVSGGEPTLQRDLSRFLLRIKSLGLKVKLDTNGTNPGILKQIIKEGRVDYIAMDIKAGRESYKRMGVKDGMFENILKSVRVVMESGIPYEFRTTAVRGIVEKKDVEEITSIIEGAELYCIQQFVIGEKIADDRMRAIKPYSVEELEELRCIAAKKVKRCIMRNI